MDRSKYFYRILIYTKQEDKVAVVDREDPGKTIPIEPWLGLIVSLADGQHNIDELVEYIGSQYKGPPPAELERTIESAIERLVTSEIVMLSDEPVRLPYYLAVPQEEQDPDMAMKSMAEDRNTLQ